MSEPLYVTCKVCHGSGEVFDEDEAEPVYDSYDGGRVGTMGGWKECRECDGEGGFVYEQ